jgi:hypothetical protein
MALGTTDVTSLIGMTLVGYEQYNMSNNSRYYSLIGGNCVNYEHL